MPMPMISNAIVLPMAQTRSGKGRTDRQNAYARERAKVLRAGYSSTTAMAKALGVSQPTLSNFLNGENGAGFQLGPALAHALGITEEELFSDPTSTQAAKPVLGNLPGAQEALAVARKREPFFPPFAWEDALQTSPLIAPPRATPEALIYAARLALELRRATATDEEEAVRVDDEESQRGARQAEGEKRVREAAARGEKLSLSKAMAAIRREQGESD